MGRRIYFHRPRHKWDDRRPPDAARSSVRTRSWLRLRPRPPMRPGRSSPRSTTRGSRRPWTTEATRTGPRTAICRRTTSPRSTTRRSGCTRLTTRPCSTTQMAEIQRAGIGQIAVSWWGKGSPEDQRLPGVIAAAQRPRHRRRCPHRAVHGADGREHRRGRRLPRARSGSARSTSTRRSSSPRPPGRTQRRAARRGNHHVRPDRIRRPGGRWPLQRPLHLRHRHLDARRSSIGSAPRRTRTDCSARPPSGPGYDARRATGDPAVKPRRDGVTYDSMWHAAIAAGADEITITSFNEWQEGTQIEPAAPPSRHGGVQLRLVRRSMGARRPRCRNGISRPHRVLGRHLPRAWKTRPYLAPT